MVKRISLIDTRITNGPNAKWYFCVDDAVSNEDILIIGALLKENNVPSLFPPFEPYVHRYIKKSAGTYQFILLFTETFKENNNNDSAINKKLQVVTKEKLQVLDCTLKSDFKLTHYRIIKKEEHTLHTDIDFSLLEKAQALHIFDTVPTQHPFIIYPLRKKDIGTVKYSEFSKIFCDEVLKRVSHIEESMTLFINDNATCHNRFTSLLASKDKLVQSIHGDIVSQWARQLQQDMDNVEDILKQHDQCVSDLKGAWEYPKSSVDHAERKLLQDYVEKIELFNKEIEPVKSAVVEAMQLLVLEYFKYYCEKASKKLNKKYIDIFNDKLQGIASIIIPNENARTVSCRLVFDSTFAEKSLVELADIINKFLNKCKTYQSRVYWAQSLILFIKYFDNLLKVYPECFRYLLTSTDKPFAWDDRLIEITMPIPRKEFDHQTAAISALLNTFERNFKEKVQALAPTHFLISKFQTTIDTLKNELILRSSLIMQKRKNVRDKLIQMKDKLETAESRYKNLYEKYDSLKNEIQNNVIDPKEIAAVIKVDKTILENKIKDAKVKLQEVFNYQDPLMRLAKSINRESSNVITLDAIESANASAHQLHTHVTEDYQQCIEQIAQGEEAYANYKADCLVAQQRVQHEDKVIQTATKLLKIIYDIDYWSTRVDPIFGSRSKLRNAEFKEVAVPKGIYDMVAELDTIDKSVINYAKALHVIEILKQQALVALERSGWKCCFHLRRDSTTEFYQALSDLNRDNSSPLKKIHDINAAWFANDIRSESIFIPSPSTSPRKMSVA